MLASSRFNLPAPHYLQRILYLGTLPTKGYCIWIFHLVATECTNEYRKHLLLRRRTSPGC